MSGRRPGAGAVPGHNIPALTVSELSGALRRVVEGEFGRVRVRGEISGVKRAGSGHLYLTLKDDSAVLDAVCWRSTAARLAVKPEDGLEVIATGRLTIYAGRSRYQIVIEALEVAGEGALLRLLEERRRKLAAEGLFDADRKQALPFLPDTIGVVTSPSGAVIRDILHRLGDRFPRRVLLWPVRVQGESAADEIAAAIAGFNAIGAESPIPRPDLLIVARGGGSIEDLWSFNEEIVVRAAAASAIPLISAVGHETDTTLIDHAADRRAPTPSAAAEIAVPVRSELVARLLENGQRLVSALSRLDAEARRRLEAAGRGLPDPQSLLEARTQQLDDRAERLDLGLRNLVRDKRAAADRLAAGVRPAALMQLIGRRRERTAELGTRLPQQMARRLAELGEKLHHRAALLDSFSYARVLDRGFALVRDPAGRPVTASAAARRAGRVTVRFADGSVAARIEAEGGPGAATPHRNEGGAPGGGKRSAGERGWDQRGRNQRGGGAQGSLL